eukprot:2770382-Pyramimonas_sp.AAC.1
MWCMPQRRVHSSKNVAIDSRMECFAAFTCGSRPNAAHIRQKSSQQFVRRRVFKMWLSSQSRAHSSQKFATVSRMCTVDVSRIVFWRDL